MHEINDVAFVEYSARRPARLPDLQAGGGLSTNPKIGVRLGAFVRPGQVAEVWAGVTSLFRDYDTADYGSRARLKFLIADWGAARFREILQQELPGLPALPDGPLAGPAAKWPSRA